MLLNFVLAIVVLLIAYVCLVLVLRVLGVTSIPLKGRTAVLEKETRLCGETFTPAMGLWAAVWGILALMTVYGAGLVYCAVTQGGVSLEDLYKIWSHSDAVHYRKLAELGYHGYVEDGQHLFLVFFPLYPWLVHLLQFLIRDYSLCGHLLSALCYVNGCYVLARLVTEDFGWEIARKSLLLFSAYPFAFFFAGMFTESLFFLLSVSTFYFIRKHRYLLAGLTGALAALTRMQGMFLLFAALAEYAAADMPLRKLKERDRQGLWRDLRFKIAPVFLMLLGVAVYLWLNYDVEGDPFRFSFYQRDHWFQHFVPLPECLSTIWNNLAYSGNVKLVFTVWLPDLAVFLLCMAGLLYAVRRLPVAWAAYLLLCIVINYSLSWPLSCGRYIACAFPLPVAVAAASRRRPPLGQTAVFVFAVLQGVFLLIFLSTGAIY